MTLNSRKKNLPFSQPTKTKSPKLLGRFVTCFQSCWERDVLVIIIAMLILYCGMEFWTQGGNLKSWDLLLITGLGLFIVGICLSCRLPGKMNKMLDRLFSRHSLLLETDKRKDFKKNLENLVNRNSRIAACIVAAAIMVAFIKAYWGNFPMESIVLAIFETLGGYIAGIYLGRMVGYGQLGLLLKKKAVKVNVIPGHLDGVGGLKPVGDFYFFQAMVASLPAAYLAIWWFLIPAWPQYAEWREPYIGLLIISILFEISAFFLPTWSFHKVMQAEKENKIREADKLSFEIASLEVQILESTDTGEQKILNEQLFCKTKKYWSIENLPTWPFDSKTRRRFSLNNAVLFLPFIDKTIEFSDIGKIISKIFSIQ